MAILDHDPTVLHDRPRLLILADKATGRPNWTHSWPNAEYSCDARTTATAPRTRPNTCSDRSGN
jgi:hypothetical protein